MDVAGAFRSRRSRPTGVPQVLAAALATVIAHRDADVLRGRDARPASARGR